MSTEDPPRSKQARMAGLLERWLWRSAICGTRGMLISSVPFVGYIVIRWILTVFENRWAPSDFLSMIGSLDLF